MSHPVEPASHCPFLGIANDPESFFGFPTDGNYCHIPSPAEPVALAHQSRACLTPDFFACPVYQAGPEWRGRLPAPLRGRRGAAAGRPSRVNSRAVLSGFLGAGAVIIVAVVLMLVVYLVASGRADRWLARPQVPTVSTSVVAVAATTAPVTSTPVPQTPAPTATAGPPKAVAGPLTFTLPAPGATQCVPFVLVMPAVFDVSDPSVPLPVFDPTSPTTGVPIPVYDFATSGFGLKVGLSLGGNPLPASCQTASGPCASLTLNLCVSLDTAVPLDFTASGDVTVSVGTQNSVDFVPVAQVVLPVNVILSPPAETPTP